MSEKVLAEETLDTLVAPREVLLRIRRRMFSEGFEIVDGKMVLIENNDTSRLRNPLNCNSLLILFQFKVLSLSTSGSQLV